MAIKESALATVRVADVMHTGILTTDPSTSLREVARLMAHQRVHAVAVTDPDHARRPFGVISVLDIAAAAVDGGEGTAGQTAVTEVVTVTTDDSLIHAAQLMVEHGIDHLVVIDEANGHACGIVSGLDIAGAYAAA
jgi:CBS domain-containing protein